MRLKAKDRIYIVGTILAIVYVFSVPGTWLVGTRVALLGIGILAILAYMSEQRSRPMATVIAILIGGSSLAMVFQGLTNYFQLSASAEPWLVVYVFAQTCILVGNRGNTAKFLPPLGTQS
jgi:ABC-type Fe3+-siderophore transport system permease subunit